MRKRTKETILVTGAGGYIGSVLVGELLKRGYRVLALDAFYWGTESLRPYFRKIETIKTDIRDVKPSVVKNIKTVVHAAALSNDPMAEFNPKANFEINAIATDRFAKICKQNSVKKFIFASSASIYDRLDGGEIIQDENSKVEPNATYSLSKFKAEQAILKLADKIFCPIIFRQGTVYGYSPRMRYDLVVNTMVKDALRYKKIKVFCGGRQWRPLIDVRDVVSAYIIAIESKNRKICGEIFNLLYKNYTILELANYIRKTFWDKFKLNIEVEVDDSPKIGRNYKISSDKLGKFFGWHPKYSVQNSVENLVMKIRQNKKTDFDHPRYYNIEWMKLLVETQNIVSASKKIF